MPQCDIANAPTIGNVWPIWVLAHTLQGKPLKIVDWHCPACTDLTQAEKDTRKSFAEEKEMIKVFRQPTWEAAELLLANPDFKAYVDSYENADTSTQLNAQSEDQEFDNLTKQGYDGCTPSNLKYVWDSLQGQDIRDKAIFVMNTVNPQVDKQPTWKCEIWVRDVDLQKPGSNKTQRVNPKSLNT